MLPRVLSTLGGTASPQGNRTLLGWQLLLALYETAVDPLLSVGYHHHQAVQQRMDHKDAWPPDTLEHSWQAQMSPCCGGSPQHPINRKLSADRTPDLTAMLATVVEKVVLTKTIRLYSACRARMINLVACCEARLGVPCGDDSSPLLTCIQPGRSNTFTLVAIPTWSYGVTTEV